MFHEVLQAELTRRNWTPAHLVAAFADAGVSLHPETVNRWLNGRNSPQAYQLRALADVLDMPLDALYPSQRTAAQ